MKRRQLFEFNELTWLPSFMTSWMTSVMHIGHEQTLDGLVWAPKVMELLERSGENRIVDLCSGGGGPVLGVDKVLVEDYNIEPTVTLTDLIPNIRSANEINNKNGRITYITESINATDVPISLKGVRTVFSGFHHLPPRIAFDLLKNAFVHKQYIFIGETTKRDKEVAVKYFKAIKWFPGMTKHINPTKIEKIFTYIIPILPLMLAWDNVISCFRTYMDDEIKSWFSKLDSDEYLWENGELINPFTKLPYQYIMGYPKESELKEKE